MPKDATYSPVPFIYRSRGLVARSITDRAPEFSYLNLLNCLEREEQGMSSRYGITIINRDPNGTTGGINYPLPAPVTSLAKLSYLGTPFRYAGLQSGALYRRNFNTQGPYTSIYSGLSGQPFGSVVTNCFETSQPYLFIYDLNVSIKDNGSLNPPQLTGIDPSPYTANALPYSPLLTLIDNFATGNTYTLAGDSSFTGSWAYTPIVTFTATSGQLVTDFPEFFGIQQTGAGSFTIAGGSAIASATAPASTTTSSTFSGFGSSPVTPTETVSVSAALGGGTGPGTPGHNGFYNVVWAYSIDSGANWTTFYSISGSVVGGAVFDIGTITFPVPGLANLNTLQFKITSTSNASLSTYVVTGTIGSIEAVIAAPSVFGPISNGMLSLLAGGTASTAVSIVSVVSSGLVSGQYTTLTVTTKTAHGYTAAVSQVAVYASSNDLVDGFYLVQSTPTATTYTVSFLSNVALSSTGGVSWGHVATPATCVLSNLYSNPYPNQLSAWGFYQQVPLATASFPVGSWMGTISSNATASVGKTVALDLSQQNQVTDDDLIVLTLAVGDPAAISSIRLQFDVAGSGYTSSYYYKDLSPAYYQASVQSLEDAYTATSQQIFADTLGLLTGQPPNTTTAQLQPGNISTGQGTWVAVYLRRGDFVPVGSAGESGLDWSAITGWQIVITTNTVGSSDVSTNGLYLQWGYGPSSFGGVGYDYRYTYYNAATGTESNPSPTQKFSPEFGYLASLIAPTFLRQAVQVAGRYSSDTQVSHVRIYRRGGTYSSNWFQIDQIPNLPAIAQFTYKDVIPDAVLAQAYPLLLDNDPPVTSSLQFPVQTTLSTATSSPGTSIYSTFAPQLITVAQSLATFVLDQIVVIGFATSLEEVRVTTPGIGQFSAIVRLQHNAGEPVAVFSIPRQPCNLAELAYGQVWLAGDFNNPHYLYFSKNGRPESFSPAAYIPVGSPKFPITALWNWRGNLFVRTTATWWLIVGGAQPYAQPTGSMHGSPAIKGIAQTEQGLFYRSPDGQRLFQGSDGTYMSLPIEFVYRQTPQTPLPLADPSQASADVMAYFNNDVFTSYVSLNSGTRYRLVWSTTYQRFRIDDIAATAMLWEQDTNLLLVGVAIGGQYFVCQDQTYGQDYDDGGWSGGHELIQTPINLTLTLPFNDLGQPHFPKQFNVLETDVNTQGQAMSTTLTFNTEPPITLNLPSYTGGSTRAKKQFQITAAGAPAGAGQQAYSMSLQHTMAVTVAPIFYQENIYAAVLADYRTSFDTYWLKLSTDQSKIVKQCYFDYTSTQAITVNLYADGSLIPYYTFTLPAEPTRLSVRRLFIAWKPRLWRMIATCSGDFQFWSAPSVESRGVREGSTWSVTDLGSNQP